MSPCQEQVSDSERVFLDGAQDMSTMTERSDVWAAIEREALAQVRTELAHDETTPLVFGAAIAWSECLMGRTNGVSLLHRVGMPQHEHEYTTCGDLIPPPIRWIPLSPATI